MSTRSKAKERHFTIDELRRYQLRADAMDDKHRGHVLRSAGCKDGKFDISRADYDAKLDILVEYFDYGLQEDMNINIDERRELGNIQQIQNEESQSSNKVQQTSSSSSPQPLPMTVQKRKEERSNKYKCEKSSRNKKRKEKRILKKDSQKSDDS
ncbi:MAG: hypothetical protein EZS28_022056 [Streblomastix strix]|uniref:Uncharacterized protein n=1 Tax=Streblomastix strix TaxID=222440 RepID=A0A5J4VIL0_9EUKA|nr:MAG: hypothetical protein EZS28_022056 [Streblomastix strix]